ncbi:hypothetical protein LQE92_12275 [Lacrimispora sp. NSJ-141]|uniref:Uncharacterized protein n=1 Tax=Lientehia hominis TaxID=2897778 RepID=A0AAP2W9K5_9FIRM|nr:hypothetical protein [Lientehia hominis]MCD2493391.1 hypothetical protein [Lientehia hominis]
MNFIQYSAAGRAPTERFRAGLKASAAGQRPVFSRRRETGNHKDFLSTCERYCRNGDKAAPASPANRNRDGPELLSVFDWSLIGIS